MNFIESVKNLCFADIPDEGLTAEQSKLRLAAKSFLSCDEERAEELARDLYSEAGDMDIKDTASDLLFSLLLMQDRYNELVSYGLPKNDIDALQIAMLCKPLVYAKKDNLP